ncbi:hypothetical protein ES677_09430 [Bizionia gelidisalsuginis]|uniref:Uncharacterized protein n=2 Tax=Bizionia TaxID=283785 RepID=A0A8H2LEE7_9FLAO|nr:MULTISPECIES: hypothetical protein [Bizionia]TYB76748.1 hypothetical protein ES676_05240 [Bizionia saleffrena]TYC11980.1 hypothetical protein ES677_09430 [Bizionia gelidisalsuginis]
MRRVLVDYKKLTPEVLQLLTSKFPDGYGDKDIITFDNHRNETIEAIEVKTEDTTYLVKVSCRLHYTMANLDDNIDLLALNEAGHIIVEEAFFTKKDEEDEEE